MELGIYGFIKKKECVSFAYAYVEHLHNAMRMTTPPAHTLSLSHTLTRARAEADFLCFVLLSRHFIHVSGMNAPPARLCVRSRFAVTSVPNNLEYIRNESAVSEFNI